ncbi:MAG: FtsX-like permease family protein [Xanthomonadaceae bacterium]|nr:FtsX-like permease family protein [Rhodospirillaceae bacterium]NIA17659.1 FtsX-like permease family protein [Xanthomonadaceae bacterium]
MFFRIIQFAFQDFYRNFWLAIITITMLVVTLFSVTALVSLNVVSDQLVKSIENKIDVTVYFKQDVDESQILKTRIGILSLPEVKKVTFVNKNEALVWLKEKYKNNQSILSSVEILDKNPLPNFFIIKAKNSEDYPKILDELNKDEYNKIIKKKGFNDHKIFINKISFIKDKTKKMGIIIIAIFSFIASLIVFNTVRIAIYTHRNEIKIMRLVGASDWFIRAPFLLEEFFYAFISLLILMSFFYPLLNFIQPHLNYFLEYNFDLISYFKNNLFFIFGSEFVAVILINMISSFLAIKKYLKV